MKCAASQKLHFASARRFTGCCAAKPSTINLHTPHGEALENKELTFGFRVGGRNR
jgi:hypothetical protein